MPTQNQRANLVPVPRMLPRTAAYPKLQARFPAAREGTGCRAVWSGAVPLCLWAQGPAGLLPTVLSDAPAPRAPSAGQACLLPAGLVARLPQRPRGTIWGKIIFFLTSYFSRQFHCVGCMWLSEGSAGYEK